MTEGRTLAIFDFDKTLVARDSFRLFGNLCASGPAERLLLLAYAVASKARLISNARYKELVLKRVWLRLDEAGRAEKIAELSATMKDLRLDAVVDALASHVERGDITAVLSASPVFYLRSIVAEIAPGAEVHGSEVTEIGGNVRVDNLYGERKTVAAAGLIERVGADRVHVYTDHKHDLGLMKLADRITLVRPDRATLIAAESAGLDFEVLVP